MPPSCRQKPKITEDHALQMGLFGMHEVEVFASDFIFNFIADLNTYLKRAPKLKKEMLKHL